MDFASSENTAMMRRIVLILLGLAVGSAVVLESNQYFDRILSDFGQEVTFYGLGLNFSAIQGYNQKLVKYLSECKTIFRVVSSCVSAFAEILENNTVICTYFQNPIYKLPTIRREKGKSFAFYKEPPTPISSTLTMRWSSLTDNGMFYTYEGTPLANQTRSICEGNYPNGHVLRLKTTEDMDLFRNVVSILSGKGVGKPYSIDLTLGSNKQPVWRDGTTLNTTLAAQFIQSQTTIYSYFYFYLYTSTSTSILYNGADSRSDSLLCQVNPYQK